MAKGFKHGTSGKKDNPLNFQVKTYPSETELKADKPTENTIGICTTTTMNDWVFSATEPTEPKVGMVWFSVGKSSTTEFNALKENTLQVYPLSAKQYEGGAWVDKTAMSYQNGEWVDWIPAGALYYKGDECTRLGGNWINKPWKLSSSDYNAGSLTSFTKNSDHIEAVFNAQSGYPSTTICKEYEIDLTSYSTATFKFTATGTGYLTLFATDSSSTYYSTDSYAQTHTNVSEYAGQEESVLTMDISSVNTSAMIGVGLAQNTNGVSSKLLLKEVVLT